MEMLALRIKNLPSAIHARINARMKDFALTGMNSQSVFSELCFCICTANCSFDSGLKVQKRLEGRLMQLTQEEIKEELKSVGYRFNNRARELHLAKKHTKMQEVLKMFNADFERREWLLKNVRGLGMKESSHFLRNIGYADCAIIDRHILRLLAEHFNVDPQANLTKKRYIEYEQLLEPLAQRLKIPQGKLDLYLWYLKTGRVEK